MKTRRLISIFALCLFGLSHNHLFADAIPVGAKVYAGSSGAWVRETAGGKKLFVVDAYTVGTIQSGVTAGVPISGSGDPTLYDWYYVNWSWTGYSPPTGYSATAAFVYSAPLAPTPDSPGTEDQNSPEILADPTVNFEWSAVNPFQGSLTTDYLLNVRDLDAPGQPVSNYPTTATSYKLTLTQGHHYRWNLYARNAGLYDSQSSLSATLFFYVALPNLAFFQPSGWSDKLVISKQANSTTDSTSFTTADTIYIDWAGMNNGSGTVVNSFFSALYLDGNLMMSWSTAQPVAPNGDFWIAPPSSYSLGLLSAGTHTVKVTLDYLNNVTETDESLSDNSYSKTFTVQGGLSLSMSDPNSGNSLSACGSYPVSWTVSGDTSSLDHFRVSYTLDGTTYLPAPDTLPASARSYSWAVPQNASSTEARVRITAYNSGNVEIIHADNPQSFSIIGSPVGPLSASFSGPLVTSPGRLNTYSSTMAMSPCYTYLWTTKDGQSASGTSATFTFNASGDNWVKLVASDTLGNSVFDSKTVNVQPQIVGSGGGGSSGNAQPSLGADPVNLASGNYTYQHTDIHLPGIGAPLDFQRFYNSKFSDQSPFPFGYGWSFGPYTSVTNKSSYAVVTYADGHSETHTNIGNAFVGEPGVFDQLIQAPNSSWLLITKNQTTNYLDSKGRLVAITDKNGNTIQLAYDTDTGRLKALTNAANRFILFSASPANPYLIGGIEDSLGRHIYFGYDGNTNLQFVTNASGAISRFAYNAHHQLTDLWDNRGNVIVHNDYDPNLNAVTNQYDALGNRVSFSFDFAERFTVQTNALGKPSYYYFDGNLLLTNILDEAGNRQVFAYDSNRNRTYVRDKNGDETRYSYDALGNLTNKSDALQNKTVVSYDSRNNPTKRIDALSNVTTFGYDGHGNLTATTNALGQVSSVQYNPAGLPTVLTDARGFRTTNLYDSQGNFVAVIDAIGAATRFEYDAAGRRIRQIDALNRTNSFFYDASDNLLYTVNALGFTNSFTYDANNNRTSSVDARGGVTTSIFDAKDRLLAVIDALSNGVTNTYDALDRKISSLDPRGNPTSYAYDPVGNLTAITNALGEATTYTYDANGNQTSAVDPLGNVTTNFFDALNRRLLTVDPLSHSNATGYDALGRITATTNANGQVTRFAYDPIGRLTNVVDAAGGQVFFSYDPNGNRIGVTGPNGFTWTNVFDGVSRLVEQDDPLGHKTLLFFDLAGNLTNKVTSNGDSIFYRYDALDRRTRITYPTGATVVFAYDASDNRTNMVDSLGTTTWQYDLLNRLVSDTDPFGQTVVNSFDASGNRVRLTYPGGNLVHYGFDALNRMIALTNWLGGVVMYAYDHRGNVSGAKNANGSTVIYGYDAADRLVTLTNLAADDSVIAWYTMTLDAAGNRTSSEQAQPLVPILTNQTNIYTYDADNELVSLDGQPVIHNANGDLISIGTNWNFAYDFDDQLVQFSTADTAGACAYDGLGNRLSRLKDGQTTRFVLDRSRAMTQLLVEADTSGTPIAYYVSGIGIVECITPTNAVATYHFDPAGSTIALSDSSGTVSDTYAYDSFGNVAASEGVSIQPFYAMGQYGIVHDGNGLYYARARHFLSSLGRFLTKDPVDFNKGFFTQRLNKYTYALNNPFSFRDESGRFATEMFPPRTANSTVPVCLECKGLTLSDVLTIGVIGLQLGLLPETAEFVPEEIDAALTADAEIQSARSVPNPWGRLGSPTTRLQIEKIADELESQGYKITGGGGRLPEEYIPGPGGGRAGSSYPDITAVKDGETVRINTIDTVSDRVTPTSRESINATRIRSQRPDDKLILIPKW